MRAREERVELDCECAALVSVQLDPRARAAAELRCATCGRGGPLDLAALDAERGLWKCLCCGHPELYSRKDFPRALGLAVVVVAAILAPFTHYLSLLVAAAIDALLYLTIPDVVVCYVCGARHRGFARKPRHPRFDREIEERLRYGKRAVMGRPMREGGTANAPEPEH